MKMTNNEIKKSVLAGAVFVYPTDTLYGIGCNALDGNAVERIKKIKGRDANSNKPMSVIMGTLDMVREYCEVDAKQLEILINCLPGPFTFILKLKRGKALPVTNTGKIGVRVPEHQFARKLSSELGIPIVTTSANISGKKDASKVSGIDKKVLGAVDFTVDMGETRYKQGSTVIDLTEKEFKVLRKGAGSFGL